MELEFEWDERKDKANQIKHGVSFEEAATVFDDPLSLNFDDPEHSRGEERYIRRRALYYIRLIKSK